MAQCLLNIVGYSFESFLFLLRSVSNLHSSHNTFVCLHTDFPNFGNIATRSLL